MTTAESRISTVGLALVDQRPVEPVLLIELATLAVGIQSILITHFPDIFNVDALLEHQARRLGNTQGITVSPVSSAVDKNSFGAILPDNFHHPFVTHLGSRIDGKGSPVPAVQHVPDSLFVVVINNHF